MKTQRLFLAMLMVSLLGLSQLSRAEVLGPGFSFQGQLKFQGLPANGPHDMEFRLFDALNGGNQLGAADIINDVDVADGVFRVELNNAGEFGATPFDGARRWLQVIVDGTPLAPRMELMPTPYALGLRPGPLTIQTVGATYTEGLLHTNGTGKLATAVADTETWIGAISPTPLNLMTSGATRMHITSLGDVGIGTASPQGKFEVAGPNNSYVRVDSATSDLHFRGGAGGAMNFINDNLLASTKFVTGGAERLTISRTGNVGIGTSNPGSRLHVVSGDNSYLAMDNTYGDLYFNGGSDGIMAFSNDGAPSGRTTFMSQGVERMVITNDGKIGIGTNTPLGMVDINSGSSFGNSLRVTNGFSGAGAAIAAFYQTPFNIGALATDSAGVHGYTYDPSSIGVVGQSYVGGVGVEGRSGDGTGVKGEGAIGVNGVGASAGVQGDGFYGIKGTGFYGVFGATYDDGGTGVSGTNYGFGQGSGVRGANRSTVFNTTGVQGVSELGQTIGVEGSSGGAGGAGVVGRGTTGGYFEAAFGGSSAGVFVGQVHVSGYLFKNGGGFLIDHPLEPANKYLYHSFVESPDMKNLYDGIVVTDEDDLATVTLPDWFGALNKDFRYQLTVIGDFAQAIVARKIANNEFTIRTDKPRVEVSWQVTGTRHDVSAEANRIPVEKDKEEWNRGYYVSPAAFGLASDWQLGSRDRELPAAALQTPNPGAAPPDREQPGPQ